MAEEAKEPKKGKRKGASGLFIPAGLFIGMGIGWALGYFVQGMFIGWKQRSEIEPIQRSVFEPLLVVV